MHLTAHTDYSLRVLMFLALHRDRTVTVAEIAAAYGISAAHLNKVVQNLALAGDIETLRGRKGGIRLARRLEAINLAEVVRRSEPDMELAPCFASNGACILGRCCLLKGALRRAGQAFLAELGRLTLADLVGRGGPTADIFAAGSRASRAPASVGRRSGMLRSQSRAAGPGRKRRRSAQAR
jgi:Rrf2 family nitric oxide-sensitive transcriptional repressor